MRIPAITRQVAGLLAACALAACASYDNPYYVHSVWRPADGAASSAPVFFVTDRKADGTPGGFGYEYAGKTACGRITASIPAAKLPAGPDIFAKPVKPEAIACAKNGASFAGLIAAIRAATPDCHRVMIFVHGYYTGFATAALRTAQLKSDTQWPCGAIAFSWSSTGKARGYAADKTYAVQAEPMLDALIGELQGAGLESEIIAHSMGTFLVLDALAKLTPNARARPVGELLLYAPDIGADANNDDFLPRAKAIAPIVRRITIYASSGDAVLAASRRINGTDRLGRTPDADLRYRAPGTIDVIDASDVPGDFSGHNYYGLAYEAVDDMALTLAGISALDRSGSVWGRKPTLRCKSNRGDCVPALRIDWTRQPDPYWRLLRWLVSILPLPL